MSEESAKTTKDRISKIHKQIEAKFPKNTPAKLDSFIISDEIKAKIVFTEELQLVTCDSEEELGAITISVSLHGPNRDLFLVRSSVKGMINGEQCGATVMSIVDRNFITIQERRTEYAAPSGPSLKCPSERQIFFAQEANGYHCSVAQRHKDMRHIDRQVTCMDYEHTKYLIGEGANLLLLRYLAITAFSGEFDAVTVMLSGRQHLVNYTSTGIISKEIQGKEMDVVVVERTIYTSKISEEKMITTLTRTGQEVLHEWDEWSYHYRVRPLQEVEEVINNRAVNVNIPLHLQWEKDIQMVSKYLDMKVRQRASHHSYMLDNPNIRNMMADFVQSLLLLKPKRVMPFAVEHFSAFAVRGGSKGGSFDTKSTGGVIPGNPPQMNDS